MGGLNIPSGAILVMSAVLALGASGFIVVRPFEGSKHTAGLLATGGISQRRNLSRPSAAEKGGRRGLHRLTRARDAHNTPLEEDDRPDPRSLRRTAGSLTMPQAVVAVDSMSDMGTQSPQSLRRLLQQRVQEATEEQERAWGEVVDASTLPHGERGAWSAPQEILDALADTERVGVLFALVGFVVLMGLAYGTVHADWILRLSPWAGSGAVNDVGAASSDTLLTDVHLTPLRSIATGAGAGLTRGVSRMMTFPLDTLKTRQQVSMLRPEDRGAMPEEMCRVIDKPVSFKGVFRGSWATLAQAAPSNAVFFLVYDTLNSLGAAALLAVAPTSLGAPDAGVAFLPTALHLFASSVATVPSNLIRTPAEVVKQRLQVGQESGNSWDALRSIVKTEGVGGLFTGREEQLLREIPFNALQFTTYEVLKSAFGVPGLWGDAGLGSASSVLAAIITQPIDTVKTRVMTKSVPGTAGQPTPSFLESARLVAGAEGLPSLFQGLVPRLALVSVGGAFYFWGQEFMSQVMSRAGF